MAGGIAVQTWLSITKPGGRTRWVSDASGRPVRLPTAAARVVASAVAAPVLGIAVGTIVGFPTPVLSLAAAVASRRRVLREIGRQPARAPDQTGVAAGRRTRASPPPPSPPGAL